MNDYIEFINRNPKLFNNIKNRKYEKVLTGKEEIEKAAKELKQKIGIVYEDKYILLLRDAVVKTNGNYGTYIRIISSSGKAGTVILVMNNKKILFVNHYRHALGKEMLELPRGFGETNLSIEENAKKELFEESSLTAEKVQIIGKISPDSGILGTEANVVYIETGSAACKLNDKNESIATFKWITPKEIIKMIENNKITDGYTLSAVMMAYSKKIFC